MSFSSGRSQVNVLSPGVAGSEHSALGTYGPHFYGYNAMTHDPRYNSAGAQMATASFWAQRILVDEAFTCGHIDCMTTVAGATVTAAATQLTVAAGSNGVDISTFAGAGTLNANASTAGFQAGAGNFIYVTLASNGRTVALTTGGVAASTFTSVNSNGQSGVLTTGDVINQSYNQIGLYSVSAGTATLIGLTPDQAANFATAAGFSLVPTAIGGASLALTAAGSYYIGMINAATTIPKFAATTAVASEVNVPALTAAQTLVGRIGNAGTGTSMKSSFTPSALVITNNSYGFPWFGLRT